MLSKKDKLENQWVTVGSDSKKIRSLWEQTSRSKLPILILGEPGVGKTFWIKESLKIRNLKLEQIVHIDFAISENSVNQIFETEKDSNSRTYYISNLSKAQNEIVIQLHRWWKDEKYKDNSRTFLYWEISNYELDLFSQNKHHLEFYDSLKSFRFELPNLQKRAADLPSFVNVFLNEANEELGKKVNDLDEEFYIFFKNKIFKNNLEELRDMIFALVGFSSGKHLYWKQIPNHFFENDSAKLNIIPGVNLETYEKEIIISNLFYTKGNREKTAKLLGISERNLYRKIHQFHLEDLSWSKE
ncbi:helix-turn-helix domain-containing protein [Leptospira sp. 96542]|nr:helix-turn-helix domain-containing protein [Leptospira sp. 96542]